MILNETKSRFQYREISYGEREAKEKIFLFPEKPTGGLIVFEGCG